MSKLNLRGKGKKDERIAELEERLEQQDRQIASLVEQLEGRKGSDPVSGAAETGSDPLSQNPFTAPTGKVRRRQIRARAYILYRGMGGDAIDQGLRNAHQKGRCYNAQLRAAEYGNADLNYGATITPYEDRMNTSTVARLSKEKRALLDLCLKEAELDAKECEEFGADYEQEENSDPFVQEAQRRSGEEPRLTFTKEEEESLLSWLEGGQKGDEPPVGVEVRRAIKYCDVYPERMPQELIMLTLRIDEAARKARANRQPAAAAS